MYDEDTLLTGSTENGKMATSKHLRKIEKNNGTLVSQTSKVVKSKVPLVFILDKRLRYYNFSCKSTPYLQM